MGVLSLRLVAEPVVGQIGGLGWSDQVPVIVTLVTLVV
jgi:hypothetical protein